MMMSKKGPGSLFNHPTVTLLGSAVQVFFSFMHVAQSTVRFAGRNAGFASLMEPTNNTLSMTELAVGLVT